MGAELTAHGRTEEREVLQEAQSEEQRRIPNHIDQAHELRSDEHQIRSKLAEAKALRDRVGAPRTTVKEQRDLLYFCGERFRDITSKAVDGHYHSEDFFEVAEEGQNPLHLSPRLLRTKIDLLHQDFSDAMWDRGHYWNVYNPQLGEERPSVNDSDSPRPITLKAFVEMVTKEGRKTNSKDVPTAYYGPSAIGRLFKIQCSPWKRIADEYLAKVAQAVAAHLVLVAHTIAGSDEQLFQGLYEHLVKKKLEDRKVAMKIKLDEIYKPFRNGLMRTYDRSFYVGRDNRQNLRFRQATEETVRKNLKSLQQPKSYNELIEQKWMKTHVRMSSLVAADAYDTMEAHYWVSHCPSLPWTPCL